MLCKRKHWWDEAPHKGLPDLFRDRWQQVALQGGAAGNLLILSQDQPGGRRFCTLLELKSPSGESPRNGDGTGFAASFSPVAD